METHNPKRETQKVLDHPRERTQKNSDDAVQRNVNTSIQLAKEVTIFNNPLIMDDDFRRELEAIREQSNLYRDERLRMETLPSSNQIDLEYMRHIVRCATMENDVNEYLERTKTNTRISSRNLNNRSPLI
ncbi:hypothetical protein EVAR_32073_1 [Eumeta japonica]|uniref:Uncharacterized protein n=1 Tax=Eumeta variegata TaxID=151549 RepID=A0A4C1WQZ6_EUMVA|nr:hypothetical protein EVAR_32073_1 [Eumeta japonica]